ncbi:MAG: 16S rRNA (cytidine(1402)-2'-O)-methyltransferase [Bacteroidota bacterium]|nr:16S rRNA (cytidine(1402)-2'-O)-methyltransferase [Bacteroidota bacterium]
MGKLYVVPTPIGNLEDMTLRAIRVLKEVDVILAEDTRTTSVLLRHYEISKKLWAYHKFNEHKAVESLVNQLQTGQDMALVSDAGTPSISDPGFLLVRACVESGVEVECLPGPTALIPAIVNSGFPSDKFCFEGFLPQKKGRQKRLQELALEERTLVMYESPFRLVKLLQEIAEYFGTERQVTVSRELTKFFEETLRGTASELVEQLKDRTIKGEIVVVIRGKE